MLDNDTVGTEVNKIQKPGPLSSGFDSNSLLPGPGDFHPSFCLCQEVLTVPPRLTEHWPGNEALALS